MAEGQEVGESSSSSVASDVLEFSFSIEALRRWIVAFVVCNFNVDIGVEVEYCYPPTPQLSAQDISAICSNSFPERNSDTEGDVSFHFRFQHTSPSVSVQPAQEDSSYWYGFCLFRQQKDTSVKRNYRQKSLVLISQHNFVSLFRHLVKTVALIDFDVSHTIVESACANIASWNSPIVGYQELPFLGSLLNVHIPPYDAFPLQGLTTSNPSVLDLTLEHSKEIFTSEPVGSWAKFCRLLDPISELYVIYEQALLCEPLLVLADEPSTCSEFISSIVDLIRPVPYAGDFRPYLTLQSDFFIQAEHEFPMRNYLVGVTNPFFLNRLVQPEAKENIAHVVYLNGDDKIRKKNSHISSFNPFSEKAEVSSKPIANETKGYIAKDWRFIKKLESYLSDPEISSSEFGRLVRRHFSILTALLLTPLNRYLATLMSNPAGAPAQYPHFSQEEFLDSLWKHGCTLQFKGKTSFQRHKNATTFYRLFVRSPNFISWLDMKTNEFVEQLSYKVNTQKQDKK